MPNGINEMTELIGRALGHYRIVEQIGEGGMGVVYRAHDERLDRDVAIKVLPEEVAGDPQRLKRFEREAKALAALNHPNIATVFGFETVESGTDADADSDANSSLQPLTPSSPHSLLVMELLEGESLRQVIGGGGLTTGKAVEYAGAIADGLAAAHEKGIIHRDLKPENVFLTRDGWIKILDFGLAKLRLPEADLSTETPTETLDTAAGGLLGTVPYMAPEQVQGKQADYRSDIFALGVVLYEMLASDRPFGGATGHETAAAILKEDPEPIAGVSPGLANVISKCLEKRPEDRFSSAHDLSLTLGAVDSAAQDKSFVEKRWPHILAVAVAAVIALVFVLPPQGLFERQSEGPAQTEIPRIVVLPFENLGAPEDEYFADGMTDEVRSRLTFLSGLEVIAWASAVQYKNTTKTADVIAKELGVSYLLMSRVRRQKSSDRGGRIRVTAELVEAPESGTPISIWQASYEDQLQDVFRVQSEIATEVAEGLQVVLKVGERGQLSKNPTTNMTAYDAFLRGEALVDFFSRWDVPVSVWRNAAKHYEYAVSLDPSFALSWARLSRCRTLVFINGSRLKSDADGALTAAERALSIAPDHPTARFAMAFFELLIQRDADESRRIIEQGLEVTPGNGDLLYLFGVTQLFQGHWLDAVDTFERVRAVDPRSPYGMWILGRTHLRMRNYSEALIYLDQTLARDPTRLHAVRDKIRAWIAQGDLEQARSVVSEAALHTDLSTLMANMADLGWILDEEMQENFLRLRPASFDNDVIAWGVALADLAACRGESDDALKYANMAYEGLLARPPEGPYWKTMLFRALALAYRGNPDEAIHEARLVVASVPIARDGYTGPDALWVLAKILIIAGEYEKALDSIELLLNVPCEISSGWLRVDPHVDPLRGHPRFREILEKYDVAPN